MSEFVGSTLVLIGSRWLKFYVHEAFSWT